MAIMANYPIPVNRSRILYILVIVISVNVVKAIATAIWIEIAGCLQDCCLVAAINFVSISTF